MNQQPSNQQFNKPICNCSSHLWLIITAIIITGLIIGLVVYYWQKNLYQKEIDQLNQQIEQLQQQIDDLSQTTDDEDDSDDQFKDWQTYRNEEYGYEIKYPNNCIILERKGGLWPYIAQVLVADCNAFDFGIAPSDTFKNTGPGDRPGSYWDYGEDIQSGNYTWRKILYEDKFAQEQLWYILQEEEYDYVISFGPGSIGGDIEENLNEQVPEFNQILSTFKFID